MKKALGLYLSAREASAELAISPATLYAYVSRGLIRSEPSSDSRSHRYRAEDVRGLKERRAPSPEPRGLRNFDADLPVMDSAIATITEDGPIYRGVNCIDLADKDTLEHAATLLWDVTAYVRPIAAISWILLVVTSDAVFLLRGCEPCEPAILRHGRGAPSCSCFPHELRQNALNS